MEKTAAHSIGMLDNTPIDIGEACSDFRLSTNSITSDFQDQILGHNFQKKDSEVLNWLAVSPITCSPDFDKFQKLYLFAWLASAIVDAFL